MGEGEKVMGGVKMVIAHIAYTKLPKRGNVFNLHLLK